MNDSKKVLYIRNICADPVKDFNASEIGIGLDRTGPYYKIDEKIYCIETVTTYKKIQGIKIVLTIKNKKPESIEWLPA